jgi:uncharacterized protein (DUF1330 family)
MPAYVVVEVRVTDPVRYEEYKKLVEPTILAHGGKYLVRGGSTEVLEGHWDPCRLVLLEFPDAQRAREWWNSEDYRIPRSIRGEAATSRMLLVEGLG